MPSRDSWQSELFADDKARVLVLDAFGVACAQGTTHIAIDLKNRYWMMGVE